MDRSSSHSNHEFELCARGNGVLLQAKFILQLHLAPYQLLLIDWDAYNSKPSALTNTQWSCPVIIMGFTNTVKLLIRPRISPPIKAYYHLHHQHCLASPTSHLQASAP